MRGIFIPDLFGDFFFFIPYFRLRAEKGQSLSALINKKTPSTERQKFLSAICVSTYFMNLRSVLGNSAIFQTNNRIFSPRSAL